MSADLKTTVRTLPARLAAKPRFSRFSGFRTLREAVKTACVFFFSYHRAEARC
jgi:hypothetical protein